jgi:uncharacterized membrane protein YbaN (DUF454 family)
MSKNMPSTITRNTTPSGHVQKHAEYNNKKYHTVRTCPKTYRAQYISWRCGISLYCTRHVFGHVLTVWYFLLLYSACFWTCSDGVVFLVIVLGMFLDISWRCGISCYCTQHVFGHVLTGWYFLLLYSAYFWTCSDGLVFLVNVLGMLLGMFWWCGISCYCTWHVFGHVLTVWYFLLLYSACFWTYPDGVVFLVIVLGMF